MAKRFLTLNIGAATIELAEYESGAKGALTLVNYGTAPLEAPLDGGNAGTILSPALLSIVRERGIKPGPVALSVSGQMVFPRFAAIPMAGGEEKFEQMIRYEVEQNIPFPIDEMICDRQVLGDTESGDKSVMIVAAKADQIEELTAAVTAAGFTPELVDVAPIALTNVLKLVHDDESSCVVMLDIGAKTTSLVIAEGDKLYNRSIPVAGNTITKEIANALGCSQEEAEEYKCARGYVSTGGVTEDDDEVADRVSKVCRAVLTRLNAELSRSINFYRSQQGGGAPVKLYLTGGTALLPQIDLFFAESLQIEVEYLNPFAVIGIGPRVDTSALEADGARISATAGLALHQAGQARFAINLLPPSLIEARQEKAKIPVVAAGGVAVLVAMVLFMLGIQHDTEVIESKRVALAAEESKLKGVAAKVSAAQSQLETAQADSEILRQLMVRRSATVARISAVRDSMVPGMWIERWEPGHVTIRYWTDRMIEKKDGQAIEQFVARLKGKSVIDKESTPQMGSAPKKGPVSKKEPAPQTGAASKEGLPNVADMSFVDKDNGEQVKQFTVELKFK